MSSTVFYRQVSTDVGPIESFWLGLSVALHLTGSGPRWVFSEKVTDVCPFPVVASEKYWNNMGYRVRYSRDILDIFCVILCNKLVFQKITYVHSNVTKTKYILSPESRCHWNFHMFFFERLVRYTKRHTFWAQFLLFICCAVQLNLNDLSFRHLHTTPWVYFFNY